MWTALFVALFYVQAFEKLERMALPVRRKLFACLMA